MKKVIAILVLGLLLSGNALANTIEAFCLINHFDLQIEKKLDPQEYLRFAGKEIKFIIDFDANLIVDSSEDSKVSVITGMYGPLDTQEFKKTSIGINYKNEIDVKGEKEEELIKYKYHNSIKIVNDKPTSLLAQIDQSGFSFNNWFFKIECRDYKYSEQEKLNAKNPIRDIEGLPQGGFNKMMCSKGKIRAIVKNKIHEDVLIKVEKDSILCKPGSEKLLPDLHQKELAIRKLAVHEAMKICLKDFEEGCYVHYDGRVN